MEWIEAAYKLPKEGEYVLIYVEGYMGISRLINGEWDCGDFSRRPMFNKSSKIMSKLEAECWMPLPNQPERSKREDDKIFNNFICGNCHGYKLSSNVCRCGALNSMET